MKCLILRLPKCTGSQQRDVPESGDLILGPTNKGGWSYAASKAVDELSLGLAVHFG
jgi:hypothetical protein